VPHEQRKTDSRRYIVQDYLQVDCGINRGKLVLNGTGWEFHARSEEHKFAISIAPPSDLLSTEAREDKAYLVRFQGSAIVQAVNSFLYSDFHYFHCERFVAELYAGGALRTLPNCLDGATYGLFDPFLPRRKFHVPAEI
jgi:hypothetical protein